MKPFRPQNGPGVENGNFRHGHAKQKGKPESPTYSSWRGMISRCLNPSDTHFRYYGGRGIKVCDRWRSFPNFLADMGERPEGKTLDRIDPNKDYLPDNCKWSTTLEQRHNRTDSKRN